MRSLIRAGATMPRSARNREELYLRCWLRILRILWIYSGSVGFVGNWSSGGSLRRNSPRYPLIDCHEPWAFSPTVENYDQSGEKVPSYSCRGWRSGSAATVTVNQWGWETWEVAWWLNERILATWCKFFVVGDMTASQCVSDKLIVFQPKADDTLYMNTEMKERCVEYKYNRHFPLPNPIPPSADEMKEIAWTIGHGILFRETNSHETRSRAGFSRHVNSTQYRLSMEPLSVLSLRV